MIHVSFYSIVIQYGNQVTAQVVLLECSSMHAQGRRGRKTFVYKRAATQGVSRLVRHGARDV